MTGVLSRVSSQNSPSTGYQLPLLGWFGTNWPISKKYDDGSDLTTESRFCKKFGYIVHQGKLERRSVKRLLHPEHVRITSEA